MEFHAPTSINAPAPRSSDRAEELLWVLEARRGCREAFALLMARYERQMLYYFGRLIRDRQAALDAHQELWVEAFRGIRRLERAEAFRAWLYQIAHHKAARYVRKEMREAATVETLGEAHEELSGDPVEAFDAEAIHRALDSLPSLQREALTLHYLRDLSLQEIGLVLDCPIGTVKSRLHHGRLAMRALLEEEKIL